MRPSRQQVLGYAAWGAPAGATLLYLVQPWDWIAVNLGLKEGGAGGH